ncbi:hypothetical protein LWI28_002119 [Acer negundo]|uniref:Uncharacterized protein n=1 Tax=Acer negundo TaxID=4023 RepID=A0AAD5IKB1_ACENE|nr:hypothetical protein LWI28_002119 [Acer negundo]
MGRWRFASFLHSYMTRTTKSHYFNPFVPLKHPTPAVSGRFCFGSRPFTAIPSRVSVSCNELDSGSFDFDHIYGLEAKEDEETGKIPVKAYFLCTRHMESRRMSAILVTWLCTSMDLPFFSILRMKKLKIT